LSIGEESLEVRLMDLFTIPSLQCLPPPRVKEDQGRIISSMSSFSSDEYLNYLKRIHLKKEAKDNALQQRKLEKEG
jgi:hypothetical protein